MRGGTGTISPHPHPRARYLVCYTSKCHTRGTIRIWDADRGHKPYFLKECLSSVRIGQVRLQ